MTGQLHTRLTQIWLVANSLFWLPWGAVCLIDPKVWAGNLITGMTVFNLSNAVPRIEVRAMYGGLQMAIGIFALIGAFRAGHRRSVLLFFAIALTGLASCRFAGMMLDHQHSYLSFSTTIAPGKYNQVGLAMYELPNAILALLLLFYARRGRLVAERTRPGAADAS